MTLLERLIKRLSLKETQPNVFVGGAGEGGVTANERLFGGLVAAQATMAAQLSVPGEQTLHSLHSYFLRPGRAASDIVFRVAVSKEGRNFAVRHVEAWQQEQLIFQLQASFHTPEEGVTRSATAPDVERPEDLPNRDQMRGRTNWQDMPIDVRMVDTITSTEPLPPFQRTWMKVNGELPDNPDLHRALVVYASDRSLLDTAWRPHADQGELAGASLDHSMWFHHAPRFDDWLLYDMSSHNTAAARGLAFGHMFDPSGRCVVTTAQEGLLRYRK